MNMIDAIAACVFVFNFAFGFLKGFWEKAVGALILVLGGAAAYVYYKHGASLLQVTLVFFLANLVGHLLSRLSRKIAGVNSMDVPSFFSRVGGGIIGGIEGAVGVLVIAVFLHFLNGFAGETYPGIAASLKNSLVYSRYKEFSRSSPIAGVKQLYATGESLKIEDGTVALDPKVADTLRQNPSLKAIFEDKELLESIQKKDLVKIVSNPKFMKLLNDKELLKQLTEPGLYEIQNTSLGQEGASGLKQ